MNKIHLAGAVALFSSVAACSEQPSASREETTVPAERPEAASQDGVYSASGEVTAVASETVTISHGSVPDLQWPAMTMTFQADGPDILAGVAADFTARYGRVPAIWSSKASAGVRREAISA